MAYKITGSVLHIGAPVNLPSKSGTQFTKRDIVITVRKFDPYTGQPSDDTGNTPKFTFVNDRCQQLDGIRPGDIVTIHFDIQGRCYEKDGKKEYFTEARPFRIDLQQQQGYAQQVQPTFGQPVAQSSLQNSISNAFPSSNQPTLPTMEQRPPQEIPCAPKDKDDLPF